MMLASSILLIEDGCSLARSLVRLSELRASKNSIRGGLSKPCAGNLIELGGNSLERPFTNRNSVVGEICHAC